MPYYLSDAYFSLIFVDVSKLANVIYYISLLYGKTWFAKLTEEKKLSSSTFSMIPCCLISVISKRLFPNVIFLQLESKNVNKAIVNITF
jgi:hypothetical protein